MVQHSNKNIIWDLEPHKIEFDQEDPTRERYMREYLGEFNPPEEMIYVASTPHPGEISIAGMGKLQGDRFTEVHIDEASEISNNTWHKTLYNRLLNPLHCPERYQYYCVYCNRKVEAFQEIICDICLKKEEKSLLLEGEDPRYNQLILED